jgi:RNA polymerase sporulation-specific sigma factor
MEYKDINDFEVLYLVEENQSEYKNIIFEKYKPVLKSLAYSYFTKLKNYGYEYEDCYQEALIGLNYAIDNFKFGKNVVFYTYAIICIKSRLNSFLNTSLGKKNRVLNESIFTYSGELNYFDNLMSASFDDMYLSFYEKILRFKNSLNDTQSQIFELKYNGFSNKEIGKLLSIHPRVVYNNLCLIRDRMKISNFSIK